MKKNLYTTKYSWVASQAAQLVDLRTNWIKYFIFTLWVHSWASCGGLFVMLICELHVTYSLWNRRKFFVFCNLYFNMSAIVFFYSNMVTTQNTKLWVFFACILYVLETVLEHNYCCLNTTKWILCKHHDNTMRPSDNTWNNALWYIQTNWNALNSLLSLIFVIYKVI